MRITYPGAENTVAIAPATTSKSGAVRPAGSKPGIPPRRSTPAFMFNAFVA